MPATEQTLPANAAAEDDFEEIGAAFALQGGLGFAVGALVSLLGIVLPALETFRPLEGWSALLFFPLAGALGGFSLAWGVARPRAPSRAAFWFAAGFLAPALIAVPAITEILSMKPAAYSRATFFSTSLAFAVGYAIAGASGAAGIRVSLIWRGALAFGLGGLAGGIVASFGPSFISVPDEVTTQQVLGMMFVVIAGHALPFVIGGTLLGRRMEAIDADLPDGDAKSRGK